MPIIACDPGRPDACDRKAMKRGAKKIG